MFTMRDVKGGGMAKAIWAVACSLLGIGALGAVLAGCGASRTATGGLADNAAAPATGGPQYRIGAEDMLHIAVWENTQLTLDVVVRPDGKISFPLVQDVQAEGLTAAELARSIQKRLEQRLRR